MPKRKTDRRGGRRPGAGRPQGTGGPPEKVRRNRVVVMLTDGEMDALRAVADEKGLPFGTAAYQVIARSLRRRK